MPIFNRIVAQRIGKPGERREASSSRFSCKVPLDFGVEDVIEFLLQTWFLASDKVWRFSSRLPLAVYCPETLETLPIPHNLSQTPELYIIDQTLFLEIETGGFADAHTWLDRMWNTMPPPPSDLLKKYACAGLCDDYEELCDTFGPERGEPVEPHNMRYLIKEVRSRHGIHIKNTKQGYQVQGMRDGLGLYVHKDGRHGFVGGRVDGLAPNCYEITQQNIFRHDWYDALKLSGREVAAKQTYPEPQMKSVDDFAAIIFSFQSMAYKISEVFKSLPPLGSDTAWRVSRDA